MDDNLYFIWERSDKLYIRDFYISTDKTMSYDPQHIMKISIWAIHVVS